MWNEIRCANTEALNAYERVQDKANAKMDIVEEAVDAIIYKTIKELERVCCEYEVDYFMVRDMFLENAREMI